MCWPTHMQKYYMAIGWYTGSENAYMSTSMHVAQEFYMGVGWYTCSKLTYMSSGTHVMKIPVGWHT